MQHSITSLRVDSPPFSFLKCLFNLLAYNRTQDIALLPQVQGKGLAMAWLDKCAQGVGHAKFPIPVEKNSY